MNRTVNRRNWYRILRVQPDASPEIIRRSYRTLLQKLRLHPDLGGDHWNASLVNEAWSVLRDPGRRAAYDRELLASHGVETISLGPLRGAAPRRTAPGTNRRNLYRILEVQPDAPREVIEASWRALRARPGIGHPVLDEAWATLRDPASRAAYDTALRTGEPHPAADPAPAVVAATARNPRPARPSPTPARARAAWVPLITRACAFCRTPRGPEAARWSSAECAECGSPLDSPIDPAGARGRRALERVGRDAAASVWAQWPEPPTPARLRDISPTGVRFDVARRLEPGWVVKIAGAGLVATAEVAYQRPDGDLRGTGARFLAVRFERSAGTFLDERV